MKEYNKMDNKSLQNTSTRNEREKLKNGLTIEMLVELCQDSHRLSEEVTTKWFREPYSDQNLCFMHEEITSVLEGTNTLLRQFLGIEIYADITAPSNRNDVSIVLKVRKPFNTFIQF